MITKTNFGSEIEIIKEGKDHSVCMFLKSGLTNTVDNNDIMWPKNKKPVADKSNVDYAAEKITEIFNDGKNKKLCLNNKIKKSNKSIEQKEFEKGRKKFIDIYEKKTKTNNKKLAKEIQKNIDNYTYPLLSNNEKKALINVLPNLKKHCLNNKIEKWKIEDKKITKEIKKNIDNNILNSLRVAWLEKAYTIINNRLFNSLCPNMITISWSFPTKTVKKILGQSINSMVDNENNYMIVINPTIADTLKVLQVLTHEMIHVHLGNECKHGKEFTQFAKSIGFEKPYTKLNPNDKLNTELEKVIEQLSNIPSGHIELNDNKKKQTTRNKLYECECGTKIRCASTLNATCNDCNSPFILQE